MESQDNVYKSNPPIAVLIYVIPQKETPNLYTM